MKPKNICRLVVVSITLGFISPWAFAQQTPDQIYGPNIPDYSAPRPVHRGKEKMEQIDAKKLPEKKVTDTKFQGSLLDMGLPSTRDTKSHQEKPENSTAKDSKADDVTGNGHNKDQKAAPTRANTEKPTASPTEKTAASKTDGTH